MDVDISGSPGSDNTKEVRPAPGSTTVNGLYFPAPNEAQLAKIERKRQKLEKKALREDKKAASLYNQACDIFDQAAAREGHALTITSKKAINRKLIKLCQDTLKYKPALENIMMRSKIFEKERQAFGAKGHHLVLVLLHDYFFAKMQLPPGHRLAYAVERHATRLRAELAREKVRRGVVQDRDLASHVNDAFTNVGAHGEAKNVRWMRINLLKWDMEKASAWLSEHGWRQVESVQEVRESSKKIYAKDPHLPDLLCFQAVLCHLPKFLPYIDGLLIAQDKASCMPAHVLFGDGTQIEDGCTALDATAAPGNKTTHLATLLTPKSGRVVAFERDKQRYETLKAMVASAGCSNVKTKHGDFTAQPMEAKAMRSARLVLVDPSCSGSGMPKRPKDEEIDPERLASLSRFQATILRFALNIPSAKRVVYSTCSIHAVENEGVVLDVLDREDVRGKWRLGRKEEVLPSWERRGDVKACRGDKKLAQGMIRCDAREDATNGFFLALLIRIE